jgi:hypothetical protein
MKSRRAQRLLADQGVNGHASLVPLSHDAEISARTAKNGLIGRRVAYREKAVLAFPLTRTGAARPAAPE